MPSLTAKDRAPLCLFSYEDGRRCRTPRIASHPHFCFYHAQKESQAQAAEALAKELDYFFSGDYLSACDLSTAMGRLIPAVIRGHIKPRLARTVAYMLQTQLQAIHLSQREYADAFGTEAWRKALRTSVDLNHNYLCPPDPALNPESHPQQPAPHPLTQTPAQSPAQTTPHAETPAQPPPLGETPAQSPAQPALRASVRAGLARPAHPPRPNSPTPLAPSTPPQTPPTPPNATPPQPPTASTPAPTQTTAPPPPQPKPATPTRDPYAVHFDHNYRLLIDGKPF
jgi:hypothetical protein